MPPSDPERLATIEQVLRDIRGDVEQLQREHREDHHRLRSVEASTGLLVEQATQQARLQDLHLRQVGVKIQWLAAAIALGGVLMSLALLLTRIA